MCVTGRDVTRRTVPWCLKSKMYWNFMGKICCCHSIPRKTNWSYTFHTKVQKSLQQLWFLLNISFLLWFRSFTLPWKKLSDQWMRYLIWYNDLWYKSKENPTHYISRLHTAILSPWVISFSHPVFGNLHLYLKTHPNSHIFYNSKPLNTQTSLVTL